MFLLDALPNVHTDAALRLIAAQVTSNCLSDARYVLMTNQLIEWSSSGTDACLILTYILVSHYESCLARHFLAVSYFCVVGTGLATRG